MKKDVKKNIVNFLCFLGMFFILMLPVIISTYQNFTLGMVVYHFIFKMCLMLFLFSIALLVWQPKYVFGILALMFLVQIPFESINQILFGNYLILDGMIAILNTTTSEAVEFSSVLIPYYLMILLCLILYIVLLKFSWSFQLVQSNRKRIFFVGLMSFTVFVLLFATYNKHNPAVEKQGENSWKVTARWFIQNEYPVNFFNRLREYYNQKRHREKYFVERKSFTFNCKRDDRSEEEEVFVLVIGEGTRYANWHINGYARETSPMLDKEPNLITFHKAFARGNTTAVAVPFILSRGTPYNIEQVYSEKTIISLFKEVGFATYWISNQDIFGTIIDSTEVDYFYNLTREGKSDLVILPIFKTVMSDVTHHKKFVVVNFRGRHTYTNAIPEQFNRYKPNIKDTPRALSISNKEYFVNNYDNMILIEDYVLGNIIKILKDRPISSLMLFASDHAVSLFDEGESLFGYGSANVYKSEIHIPMFIWCSDLFLRKQSLKWNYLKSRTHEICSTTNIFHTMGEIANIRGEYLNTHQSLCNEYFIRDSVCAVFIQGKVKVLSNSTGAW